MEKIANPYSGKASALAAIAENELDKAAQSGDKVQARQAAAKAWFAVGEAFRGLLSARGIAAEEFPRSERGRVFMHTAHGSRKLRQLYHLTKGVFHQDAYYEEVIDFTQLEEARQAMRDYLNEARELAE
ncbi:MAG: hypothetical protein LDLANPLL_02141 [Turneriella sp.]|nr:hypothetical protein [Turneriella sp.]